MMARKPNQHLTDQEVSAVFALLGLSDNAVRERLRAFAREPKRPPMLTVIVSDSSVPLGGRK